MKKPPPQILLMLGDQKWRDKMKDFFEHNKRPRKREVKAQLKILNDEPGSDADATEIDEMDYANPHRISLQKKILDRQVNITYGRALEAGAGRALLTD